MSVLKEEPASAVPTGIGFAKLSPASAFLVSAIFVFKNSAAEIPVGLLGSERLASVRSKNGQLRIDLQRTLGQLRTVQDEFVSDSDAPHVVRTIRLDRVYVQITLPCVHGIVVGHDYVYEMSDHRFDLSPWRLTEAQVDGHVDYTRNQF
jgi:hypothetical protein